MSNPDRRSNSRPQSIRQSRPATDPAYDGVVFPPALMSAACDLSTEERQRIIWHHEKMREWSHYDILHASRRDDTTTLNARFKERSLEWHPDRWFRNTGPFGAMIVEIFQRLQVARQVLTDPSARVAYDEELGPVGLNERDIEELRQAQRRAARDLVRAREQRQKRLRRNPFKVRIDRAREHAEQARTYEQGGDLLAALRSAQLAVEYDPRNEEHQALVAELSNKSAPQRVEQPLRRGRRAEARGEYEEAARHYRGALELAPNLPELHKRLALCLIAAGKAPATALSHAMRAVNGQADDAEAHYVLGRCYEKDGRRRSAVRAYKKALELKPNFKEAKKRLGIRGFFSF